MTELENKPAKKPVKKFTEYYKDPEFKEKHQKYIKEKIACDCGKSVMRVAMAKHKRTKVHLRLTQDNSSKQLQQIDIAELVEKLVNEKMAKLELRPSKKVFKLIK